MSIISVRVNDDEMAILKEASKLYDCGMSSMIKRLTFEKLEDEFDMKIISAYYSASAGGMTSDSIWGGYAPYLHSVPSFDDAVGKKGHGVGMSQHGANNLAKQGYNAYQILQYFYSNIKFAKLNKDS